MTPPRLTPLELYKLTPKTNCGKCLLPSCLAFCVAVVAAKKKITDCPYFDLSTVRHLEISQPQQDDVGAAFMEKLRKKIVNVDFVKVAPVIGATASEAHHITMHLLGKPFTVDKQGNITSECHIISWIEAPVLSYITNSTHIDITGKWVTFRELHGGIDWQGLFSSRCETPLRKLADVNPGLLMDLIDLFMGQETVWYDADIALILHPLPHIPILICYQGTEDDLGSNLTMFFDECCGHNLHIKSIYTLCAGLVKMFEHISVRHHV
jgi:hypothetical protein